MQDYIKKDKEERQKLEIMLSEAKEFLEAHGYEVFPKGTLDERVDAWRSFSRPTTERKRNIITMGA